MCIFSCLTPKDDNIVVIEQPPLTGIQLLIRYAYMQDKNKMIKMLEEKRPIPNIPNVKESLDRLHIK